MALRLSGFVSYQGRNRLSASSDAAEHGEEFPASEAAEVHAGAEPIGCRRVSDALAPGPTGGCAAGGRVSTPEYVAYHDEEWGRPVRDSRALYEKLCLEAFQSGLSWITILRKREDFRAAFAGFDPAVVAQFGEQDVERLMADAGIVRNRAKILATITNARAALDVDLAELMWSLRARAAAAAARRAARSRRSTAGVQGAARRRSSGTASCSSARRPPTRRCRPAGWSTTTSRAAVPEPRPRRPLRPHGAAELRLDARRPRRALDGSTRAARRPGRPRDAALAAGRRRRRADRPGHGARRGLRAAGRPGPARRRRRPRC